MHALRPLAPASTFTHPLALLRPARAISAASTYAGGILSPDASSLDRAAHAARAASSALGCARTYLQWLYRPTRHRDAAHLAYALASDHRRLRRQAHGAVRHAARMLAEAQSLAERAAP